jgi:GTPase Era involved in 16S rRNA processing
MSHATEETSLGKVLHSLSALLTSHAATLPLENRLHTLRGRLADGRFHLAVLGQFKRGKSTLLNALLGESFLPMGVVPVTAIPTLITYGPVRQARITFQDGTVRTIALEELADYVTETANSQNQKGVMQVEVRHPAPLLERGVVLIDTPGIGSTLVHNTTTTLNFLREVDAAFFLVSVDPPLTAVELDFLRAVQQRVNHLFFLLNKVDYLTLDEQQEALRFLETTLRTQAGLNGDLHLFPVSARQALEAQLERNAAAWAASGMAAIEERLNAFLQTEKLAALQEAIRAKTADLIGEALQLLHAAQRALTMPLDELLHKQGAFQDALATARQQRRQAAGLLQVEQKRFVEHVNEQAARLRAAAEAHFSSIMQTAVADHDPGEAEEIAQKQLADAAEAFFAAHYPSFSQRIQADLSALLTPYAAQADALLDDLRHLASDLFGFEFIPLNPDEPPTRLQTPYWSRSVLIRSGLGLAVSPGLWESLLSPARRRQRILSRLQPLAERLALRNAERLRWAVVQNTQQTLRQFQAHLDARWQETIEATAQVLETAVSQRRRRVVASAADMDAIDHLINALHALAQGLSEL